jgi:hypothetical protein
VQVAVDSAGDLFGGARVEEAGVAAVAGGAEHDHGGPVSVGEGGDALPDVAVVAHDFDEMPGHCDALAGQLLDPSSERGGGRAFVFGLDDLVNRDVGLYDVEDLEGVAERLGEIGAGSHDLVV